MKKNTISLVIITLNEEKNLARTLNSIKDIVDEIIIIDSGSTDKTEEIAATFDAKFIKQDWLGYGEQKNYGNNLAKFDYILSLDADEVVSKTLHENIIAIKNDTNAAPIYSINRLTNYCGKWIKHCGWYPDTKIRLWKRDYVKWNNEIVHEDVIYDKNLQIKHLDGDILHYTIDSISAHINLINKYTTLTAQKDKEKNKKAELKIIFNPLWHFIKSFIFRKGFLDGYYGFVVCFMSAVATFVKYAKLNELYDNE